MFATAAAVILPLLHSALSAQVGQGAQQGNSLEGRIAQLQQRIEERPKDANLHFELSKLYEEDIETYYDEALSEFKVAVDNGLKGRTVIWNDLGDVNVDVGLIALEAGNYDKAIRNFEKAARFNPNHYSMYGNIAVVYWNKKELDKAIEYWKISIDLNPSEADSYESIGVMYLENQEFRLGLLNSNRYLLLNPENEEINWSISEAHYGLKQYNKAIEAIDELPRDLRKHDAAKALRKKCVGLLNN